MDIHDTDTPIWNINEEKKISSSQNSFGTLNLTFYVKLKLKEVLI